LSEPSAASRAFFALWPGTAERARLAAMATECARHSGGRATAADNLHATLVFLGILTPERLGAARALGAGVGPQRFDLAMDRLDYRRRQAMVWAGCRVTPAPLQELVAGLQRACRHAGFDVEDRAYVPHVTLVRHARRDPGVAVTEWTWPVDGYCLARSVSEHAGVHYEVVERWQA